MILSIVILIISLAVLIKGADFAIHYATRLAESFGWSKYVVGFLIVAVISILPEAFISVTSALEGIPAFGLGTLFGSNIADLTIVFALVVFVSGRSLSVESKIIKNRFMHIGVLVVPVLLGFNGFYSRLDGVILLVVGLLFYYFVLRKNSYPIKVEREKFKISDILLLLISMGILLLSSNIAVEYGSQLALQLRVSPILIGMFVVGLSTTLPELFFAIRSAKKNHDGLALGDILGTVIADATILVGVIALIKPFAFNPRIIYISGIMMVLGAVLLFYFMKTGRKLTKYEAILLFIFYFIFVSLELLINK